MAKKVVKKRESVVRERCSGTMSESEFMSFIRSLLRRGTLRWKPRSDALNAAKRPYTGPNTRQKWEYECAVCHKHVMQKETHVDHIHEAGSLRSVTDLPTFVTQLYCEVDNLQVICKTCHHTKTHSS